MHWYSFDIFDTVLIRIVFSPKDVFLLMQKQLQLHSALPSQLVNSFLSNRVISELWARKNSKADDVKLTDIYRAFGSRHGLNDNQQQMLIELEQNVEETVLVPVDGAEKLVAEAREKGNVLFISDMYLPTDFIRGILRKFHLIKESDRLYVSGDLGLSKGSGRLFQYVLGDLGAPPQHFVHCGDNQYSDVIVPRRLGIQIHPSTVIQSNLPATYNVTRERVRNYLDLLRLHKQLWWH